MHLQSDPDTNKRGAILTFPRKRGRPKSNLSSRDLGTPELTMKRLLEETTEILDLYLKQNRLTPDQHWCGIHLRWLYTLRFGVPSVRSIDTTHLGGVDIKKEDILWSAEREREYREALKKLAKANCQREITSVCIYNEYPVCINKNTLANVVAKGLDILKAEWITI